MKTFSFVKSIIFSFVLLSVFIFSCEKNKVYDNNLGIVAGVESISLIDSENPEKGLGSDITCEIDTAEYTVSLTVAHSAILTGLKFDIKLSEGYSISPSSGEEVDFELVEKPSGESTEEASETPSEESSSKRYKKVFTVTKGDKSQEYTVYITKESAPKLTEFKISANESKGIKSEVTALITDATDTATGKILLKIPYTGTAINLTELAVAATIPDNHTLDPVAGIISEDINGKEFTLKTALGSKRVYTVDVVKGPYISAFKFETNPAEGTANTGIISEVIGNIDHTAGTVKLIVPSGVTLPSLTPTITVGENTKSEFTHSAQTNFSSNVQYTVTSSNSSATDFTKVYTVTATQNAEPRIQSFAFDTTKSGNGNKNLGTPVVEIKHNSTGSEGEIILKVPHDADLTGLTPTVTASTPSGIQVYKGESSTDDANTSSNDFSNSHDGSVKYSAVGTAGGRKVYSVKVYKEPKISAFKFESSNNSDGAFPSSITKYDGSVSGNNITITVANIVNVTSLKASITGSNIASDYVTSELNFTTGSGGNTLTLDVPNQYLPGYTKTYTVTLTKEAAPKLGSFKIPATTGKGIKDEVTADLTHEEGSDAGIIKLKFDHKEAGRNTDIVLTGLTPTIGVPAGCSIDSPSSQVVSGDISSARFTLTTALGSKRVYTVTAVKGPFIRTFKFGTSNTGISSDSAASIDHNTGAITITVPSAVARNSSENKVTLTPTIEFGGDDATTASSSPASGVPQEFTSGEAVQYIVTGKEGMQKTYQVTVTRTPSTEAVIKSFEIESGHSGNISETGTGDKGRIVVPVTSVPGSSVTPSITKSEYATVTPANAQTFSYDTPKEYTVRAEDTSTAAKIYDVYIYDSTKVLTADKLKITDSSTSGASTDITPDSKNINANTRVISITVPAGTSLTDLTLSLDSSSSYTLAPTDGQDFSAGKEVKYKLTETSSSTVVGHYWVKIEVSGSAS
ncbi:DUF5018 domain-containing protein [Ichthyobacterium seriolicida]|uniref:Pkd domain containing protein n=1 Tax=Ichthyobacterium seriolicida TaxID=242600 RepID=A0A1J1E2X7_9FLAO|nr:hypothetical protein [Ichthyobacterium seriolicida]BAV94380.1 hypothetical protein JBKA6_0367 [Ichthyobacterium seriolicida]